MIVTSNLHTLLFILKIYNSFIVCAKILLYAKGRIYNNFRKGLHPLLNFRCLSTLISVYWTWHVNLSKTVLSEVFEGSRKQETYKYGTVQCLMTPRPTQPRIGLLSGTGNTYQTKCGDVLRLGSKGRYGSFHLWINVRVADKAAWSLVNTCYKWAP